MLFAMVAHSQKIFAVDNYTGSINFHGRIIESSCVFNQDSAHMDVKCDSGKTSQISQLRLHTKNISSQLNSNIYIMSSEWINKDKNIKTVTIEYK